MCDVDDDDADADAGCVSIELKHTVLILGEGERKDLMYVS